MHGQPLSFSPTLEILAITLLALLASAFGSSWLSYFLRWYLVSAISSVIFHLTAIVSTIIVLQVVGGQNIGLCIMIVGVALTVNLPNAHITYESLKLLRTRSARNSD